MSVVNVGELMSDPDFAEPFTVRRPTRVLGNEGEATFSYEEFGLVGSIQPAETENVSEIAVRPEGARGSGKAILIFCAQELRVDDGRYDGADVVAYEGENYKVVGSKDWSASGYWEVLAVEIGS